MQIPADRPDFPSHYGRDTFAFEVVPKLTGHGLSHLASVRNNRVYDQAYGTSEIITSVERRRRWTASEKVRMVEEAFELGMTVSLVAPAWRCPNQLFTRRRFVA